MSAPDAVLIRPFRADDRDALVACVRGLQAHEAEFEPRMKAPEELGGWYFDGQLDECRRKNGVILVAEVAGAVIGYITVYATETCEDPDERDYVYAYVADVTVNEDHRGRGVGRALLEAAEGHARDHGSKWLRISVLARNRGALTLYERFGFEHRIVELEKALDAETG